MKWLSPCQSLCDCFLLASTTGRIRAPRAKSPIKPHSNISKSFGLLNMLVHPNLLSFSCKLVLSDKQTGFFLCCLYENDYIKSSFSKHASLWLVHRDQRGEKTRLPCDKCSACCFSKVHSLHFNNDILLVCELKINSEKLIWVNYY